MTIIQHATQTLAGGPTRCDSRSRVTRSLLGYGVIAGPLFIAVSLAQALTRSGFDVTRHAWSLLSNGDLGWIQIANFTAAGMMTIAAAAGHHRAGAGRWTPRLIGAYGVSLVAAGAFRADPAQGFPPGSAERITVSWHGMLHLLAGGAGFACLVAALFVAGHAFAVRTRRGWARFSRITGVALAAGFGAIATGVQGPWTTLPFVAAVILAWSWITCLSLRAYRDVA